MSCVLRCVVVCDEHQLNAVWDKLGAERRVVGIVCEAIEEDAEIKAALGAEGDDGLDAQVSPTSQQNTQGIEGLVPSKPALSIGPRSALLESSESPRIIIAYDGSDCSRAVLQRMAKLPWTIWCQCDADTRRHDMEFIRQHLGPAPSSEAQAGLLILHPSDRPLCSRRLYTCSHRGHCLVWLSPDPCSDAATSSNP